MSGPHMPSIYRRINKRLSRQTPGQTGFKDAEQFKKEQQLRKEKKITLFDCLKKYIKP